MSVSSELSRLEISGLPVVSEAGQLFGIMGTEFCVLNDWAALSWRIGSWIVDRPAARTGPALRLSIIIEPIQD